MSSVLRICFSFRGRGFVRGTLLIPYIAPVVAVAFAWRFILDPRGVIMTALFGVGFLEQPIHLLGQRPWAMMSLVLFEGWRYFPFYWMIIASLKPLVHLAMNPLNLWPVPGELSVAAYKKVWFQFAFLFLDSPKNFTLSRGIMQIADNINVSQQLLMAASVIATVPIIVLFLLLERYLVKGLTAGGVKG